MNGSKQVNEKTSRTTIVDPVRIEVFNDLKLWCYPIFHHLMIYYLHHILNFMPFHCKSKIEMIFCYSFQQPNRKDDSPYHDDWQQKLACDRMDSVNEKYAFFLNNNIPLLSTNFSHFDQYYWVRLYLGSWVRFFTQACCVMRSGALEGLRDELT